jgi:Fe2+ or Zn2+ uptake regulation protein
VVEFEVPELETMKKAIAERYGFTLKSHRLDLFGDCIRNDCKYAGT